MTPEQASRLSLAEQHQWFRRAIRRGQGRVAQRGGAEQAGAGHAAGTSAGAGHAAGTSAGAGHAAGTSAGAGHAAGTSAGAGHAGAASERLASGRAGLLISPWPGRAASRGTPAPLTHAAGPSGLHLPPSGRHLAFGADPATQMSVGWQVHGAVTAPFIRVGETPGDLGEPIAAEIRTLVTPAGVGGADGRTIQQYYLHARLAGLRPGRTYYYCVGHQGWDTAGDLATLGSFTTAPSGRVPFTFTAFGDQGVTDEAVSTAALVRAQRPAFHLHAGDISYAESGGRGLVTDPYDPRVWDAFLAEIEPAAGSIPWQVAVGNHELEAWYSADGYDGQRARFDFPDAEAHTYYSFTYGNVGFISLDANDVSYEIRANLGYTEGSQTAWLQGVLARFRASPQVDFIVAFFHHCAYSTCTSHGSDGGVRQHWAPLFDQYAVDLVINGHNHIYERTDPVRAGSATGAAPAGTTVYPATAGTTYIVAGAAGKVLYEFPADDSYQGRPVHTAALASGVQLPDGTAQAETVTWSRVRYTGYCLLVIDSQPGYLPGAASTLRIRGLAADGAEIDRIDLVR
jgi:Purple acid Phosphatase, N-terminal domain/Calcineurin-like phosphoesterase